MTLISILGPTSSGKSNLAVDLAINLNQKYGANASVVVSCDSRQVYSDLNLGTGKIAGKWCDFKIGEKLQQVYLYRKIPHFLIDFVSLDYQYTLYDFLVDFNKLFQNWAKIGFKPKFVILCGGTGLFAKAVIEEYQLDQFKPEFFDKIENLKLQLSKFSTLELQQILSEKIPNFRDILNNSDQNNPRRLINQIIKMAAKENEWLDSSKLTYPKFQSKFQFYLNPKNLKIRLESRLKLRFEAGLKDETFSLIQSGKLNQTKLMALGLEYREFWSYFIGLQTLAEFEQNCIRENWQYVRRQITWFKKQADLVEIENLDNILESIKFDLTKA